MTAIDDRETGPPGGGSDTPRSTWAELADAAAARLGRAGVEGSDREARLIVETVAGEILALVGDETVPPRLLRRLEEWVRRRAGGEPLQYVLGSWAFRRLDLFVDRRVLIPRPETEQVVEAALVELDRVGSAPVVDLGTGSGAIALAVATERPGTEVWATDKSVDALAVARANLAAQGRVSRHVRLVEGDWYGALPAELAGRVGVIVANPPYVGPDEVLPPVVADWEPGSALRSADGGLGDVAAVVGGAPEWLRPGGAVVMEHGADQGPRVRALAHDAGFTEVETGLDLAGHDRWLVARR